MDRKRAARSDLGMNAPGATEAGNVVGTDTGHADREQDFGLFDRLPKAIRTVLNHTAGKYAATEVWSMWQDARREGWTATRFAAGIRKLDLKHFPRSYL